MLISLRLSFNWLLPCCMLLAAACKKESTFLKGKPIAVINGFDQRFQANRVALSSDSVYLVISDISIRNGQEFFIGAGTLLRIKDGIVIRVQPGGVINAAGTANAPVIFTSAAPKGASGVRIGNNSNNWGGIEINGQPGKSSGSLRYMRIEFAGVPNNAPPAAGLKIENADSSTKIEYIQVSYTNGPASFAFTGGNCNASHLVSLASYGNDFILCDDYTGKLQHLLVYRNPVFPRALTPNIAGIMAEGRLTQPDISNVTVVGPDLQPGTSPQYLDTGDAGTIRIKTALLVTDGAGFRIRNSAFFGFPVGGVYINNAEAALKLQNGKSELAYSFLHSNDSSRVFYLPRTLFPSTGPETLKAFLLQPQFFNAVLASSSAFQLNDPFNAAVPNLLPRAGSPLLGGANFDGAIFSDAFFKKVNYRGAFGTENWLQGWINFTPLQTDYNEY
jgi:hypothetical protein